MEGTSDHMRNEDIPQPNLPAPTPYHRPPIPPPINAHAHHLKPPSPAPLTPQHAPPPKEAIRVGIEVEAREGHDEVVEAVLEGEEEFGEGVEAEGAVVVGGVEGGEEGGGYGEEGDVLDVWVVGWVVWDDCDARRVCSGRDG